MQLFFLPYFGGNARSWREVIALLPEFDCIALSLAGIGEKDGVYSVQNGVAEIAAQVSERATGAFLLVGHSMGGKFALGVAASELPALKGLILVAPSPPTPEPIPAATREKMLETHGTRAAALETLRAVSQREITGEALQNAVCANLETSETDWRNWLEIGSRQDISAVLPEIEVPVSVIIGDGDTGMTRALMENEITSKIVGARLEIIAGVGHLLPLEAPRELAQKIREFSRRYAAQSTAAARMEAKGLTHSGEPRA